MRKKRQNGTFFSIFLFLFLFLLRTRYACARKDFSSRSLFYSRLHFPAPITPSFLSSRGKDHIAPDPSARMENGQQTHGHDDGSEFQCPEEGFVRAQVAVYVLGCLGETEDGAEVDENAGDEEGEDEGVFGCVG